MTIEALRTDDTRFADLPDWPYAPRYLDSLPGYEGLRTHYVDEGPRDAAVVLCLHGEPTWAYLYRRMIPVFLEAGLRVVAPDFYGFGRSDKPIDDAVYTWDFHRDWLLRFVEELDLTDVYLVVQDWGGLLGLTIPVDFPNRVAGLLIMNTGFGNGSIPSEGFVVWRDFMARTPDLGAGRLIGRSVPHLTEEELAGYDAPFPGPEYKAGVRRFPAIVPTDPSMPGVEVSRRAVRWWSDDFAGPSLMAIGVQDPVLGAAVMDRVHPLIRGCPEPMRVEDGGHFLQEWGEPVARRALAEWGF
jgi:pimeloyl-ACP methyl ester carboxylesterase